MIDAVVNSSADYLAKGKIQNNPASEVNQPLSTQQNSKTSKATEVESQASAVNDKDNVTRQAIKEKNGEHGSGKHGSGSHDDAISKAKEDEEITDIAAALSELTHGYGLSFALDKELNQVVVTVTNTSTDEVIRQIPREDFIKIAKRFNELRQEMNGNVTKEDLKGFLMDSNI